MFRRPKPNMIESDEGFSVEQVGFSKLAYREGDKKITLTIEHLIGPALFVVYLNGLTDRWEPPLETMVSDDEWRRIGDNIRAAYRSQGHEIKVDNVPMSPEEKQALRRAIEQLKQPEKRNKQLKQAKARNGIVSRVLRFLGRGSGGQISH